MAFTYVGDHSTNLDRVRSYIRDTVSGKGPLPDPDATNFTDAELTGFITSEGSWQRAVAAAFETLAAEWTRHPNFSADGLAISNGSIAQGYREQAALWRKRYGGPSSNAGSRPVTRRDGYSDDVDNVTV